MRIKLAEKNVEKKNDNNQIPHKEIGMDYLNSNKYIQSLKA